MGICPCWHPVACWIVLLARHAQNSVCEPEPGKEIELPGN